MEWAKKVKESIWVLSETPYYVVYRYGNYGSLYEDESNDAIIEATLEECMKHGEFLANLRLMGEADTKKFLDLWMTKNLETFSINQDPNYVVEKIINQIRNIESLIDWQNLRETLYILLIQSYLEGRDSNGNKD